MSPVSNFSKLTGVGNVNLFKTALGPHYNVATVACITAVVVFSLVTLLRTSKGTHIATIPPVVYDSDMKYFPKLL